MEHQLHLVHEEVELAATLHYPRTCAKEGRAESNRWPLVVICHGFVGSRIGVNRLFVKAARLLSEEGYMVLRFDYGGCGESTGDYGDNGFDKMIFQTRRVLDYGLQLDCVDPCRIILLGHSLGGAVAVETAAVDKRVKKLILWAPSAYPYHDITRIIGSNLTQRIQQAGEADYQGFRLTEDFLRSLQNRQPLQSLTATSGDVLVLQGTEDEDLPSDYANLYKRSFWRRSEGQCDQELIVGADHTFTGQQAAGELMQRTLEWLRMRESRHSEWSNWMI